MSDGKVFKDIAIVFIVISGIAITFTFMAHQMHMSSIWADCVGNSYKDIASSDKLILINKCKEILDK